MAVNSSDYYKEDIGVLLSFFHFIDRLGRKTSVK